MKNLNINKVVEILSPLKLDIEKSSARRRFIRHLKGFREDYNLEADEIRKEFSEKNPDGSNKVIQGIIQFTLENRKKAEAKFEALHNLEVEIDWKGEEKDKEAVKQILQDLADKARKEKEFTDDAFAHIETLEEIIAEL